MTVPVTPAVPKSCHAFHQPVGFSSVETVAFISPGLLPEIGVIEIKGGSGWLCEGKDGN